MNWRDRTTNRVEHDTATEQALPSIEVEDLTTPGTQGRPTPLRQWSDGVGHLETSDLDVFGICLVEMS